MPVADALQEEAPKIQRIECSGALAKSVRLKNKAPLGKAKAIIASRLLHQTNPLKSNINHSKPITLASHQKVIQKKIKNTRASLQNHRRLHHGMLGLVLLRHRYYGLKNHPFSINLPNINELHSTK
jgi:hypothetical protein